MYFSKNRWHHVLFWIAFDCNKMYCRPFNIWFCIPTFCCRLLFLPSVIPTINILFVKLYCVSLTLLQGKSIPLVSHLVVNLRLTTNSFYWIAVTSSNSSPMQPVLLLFLFLTVAVLLCYPLTFSGSVIPANLFLIAFMLFKEVPLLYASSRYTLRIIIGLVLFVSSLHSFSCPAY